MAIKKSTIYDLATLAETLASTVSAILNGTWQQRRISERTALRVQALAEKQKYSVNRQASGLRTSRSGLIGMIIPTHVDHFFGEMSQAFDRMARERRQQPIVASTLRDPLLETETVKTLISYQIDSLVVTGASNPDGVSRLCRQHGVMHVNVDLPGKKAPSVVSDNHWGAAQLTATLIARSRPQPTVARDRPYFLGGVAADYATQRRIQGFVDTVTPVFGAVDALQILACGYEADAAEAEVRALHERLGGLPRALFFSASLSLEGAIRFLRTLPDDELQACAFGSYDWHPFAAFLRCPVHMMRQDVGGLLDAAFRLIGGGRSVGRPIEIRPQLMLGD